MTAIIVTWTNTSKLVIIIKYFKLKTNQYLQLCWPLCWCWGKEFPILKIQSHSKNCINERNGNCNKYFINVKHCKFILEICFVKLAFYKLLFFLAKHIVLPIHLQYIVFPHLGICTKKSKINQRHASTRYDYAGSHSSWSV